MTNARAARSAREKSAEMRAAAARKESRSRNLLVLAGVLAVLVVAVGATVLVRTLSADQAAQDAARNRTPANLTDDGFSVGNADAKAVVEVFEDFQCPACQAFEQANSEQLAGWVDDGSVRVVYRPVAILDRYSSTEYSSRALTAAAAVMDASPDAFVKYHELLFANQPPENSAGLSDGQLVDLAQQAGASVTAVQTALQNRSFDSWITKATDEFSKRGYTGTPTVVLNGTKLDDWGPTKLAEAVQAAQG